MSYLHGLFPRFLSNHKKALLWWLLHIHAKFQPILSSALPCRRDRALTFFVKIRHNSINLYQIPTKIGTEMCFNMPFLCTKFQLNPSMYFHQIYKCAKWRIIKTRKLKQHFGHSYLGIGIVELMCRLPYPAGISAANLVPIRLYITEVQRYENLNILTVWHTGFLGHMTHSTLLMVFRL